MRAPSASLVRHQILTRHQRYPENPTRNGHRRITSTMQYIDMKRAIYGEASDDEWIVKIPDSPNDAKELLQVGFEYVGDIHDTPMFRKRK